MSVSKHHILWHDIYFSLNKLVDIFKEQNYAPKAIVGIGRGGLIPATLLAYKLGVKDIHNYSVQTYNDKNTRTDNFKTLQTPDACLSELTNESVLVVDDLSDSGHTLRYINDELINRYNLKDVKTATLFVKDQTTFLPDFFITKFPSTTWLTFPWEID
jgi:hypoxanthine phosphoribosyltransferase